MKYTLLLVLLFFIQLLSAQTPLEKKAWLEKLSPSLQNTEKQSAKKLSNYTLVVTDLAAFRQYIKDNAIAADIIQEYAPAKIVVLRTTTSSLFNQILPCKRVLFVDRADRQPQEELSLSGLDLSLNKVNLAHHLFPTINGEGLTVSIKEDRFDLNDIDFSGRYRVSSNASTRVVTHASVMATILGGGGNSFYNSKGAAWGATLTSANFRNLLPENDYKSLNISAQNHSYGVGIENYYGAEAVAYDASVVEQPELLHIFSAGNRGNQASETGSYKGLNNVANLTGTFKMAKNVLVVGSLSLTDEVPLLSSKGPAYDGRVKPELVALGQDGSSGAAALTSGVALLVQQAYRQQTGGLPPAALVKAILINSADDVGALGIDFFSGYGSVNAWRALQTVKENRFLQGTLTQNQTQIFRIIIPENAQNLKITLAWSDVPAAANAERALVNDVDMELHNAGEIWLPWVLNPFPDLDSITQLPIRKKDAINTVEQITVEAPVPGEYELQITGAQIPAGSQAFFLAYQWDRSESFQWTFPLNDDPVEAGENQIVRWSTTLSDTRATLAYALDGGEWQTLAADIDLQQELFAWQAPDTFATAVFRLATQDRIFVSDTFLIARPLKIKVGYNCENEFLLFWDKIEAATSYQLYQLGDQYLEPLTSQTDTFIILKKAQYPSPWYAVTPILTDSRIGLRSYATNYNSQGVECYISNFLAYLEADAAMLYLSLGTTFGLKSVQIEKQLKGAFVPIQTYLLPTQTELQTLDENLQPGINTYRAKLELQNGSIIYTNTTQVYYAGEEGFWLFPNPVRSNQDLLLISAEIEDTEVRIFDALGREVSRQMLTSETVNLSIDHLATGFYQVSILKKERWIKQFKLVVTD